jgi:phosphomannomutase/phosphoglucomutase
LSATVFREYDIRGLVGKDLTDEFYHRVGLALGTWLERHGDDSIVVGRDLRPSSGGYASSLRRGLVETGRRVLDVGEVTTPMTVFALNFLGTHGSAAITASHNPAPYNGLKLRRGNPIFGEELQRLRALFDEGDFVKGKGSEEPIDVREAYFAALQGRIRSSRSLKVVVDAGNGSGGPFAPEILSRLGFDVVPLYCDPDGSFPNHHPDPTVPGNLADLRQAVQDERADIGVALDGDADRVTFVDETGAIHWPDRILMAIAPSWLERHPGGSVVYDVKCSAGVQEVVERAGGRAVMVKTGYPHILAGMRAPDACLGAELSGHMYFGHDALFNFDDGIHAAARVLAHFSRDPRPVSVQMAGLPQSVSTPEIRAEVPEAEKFGIVEKLQADFRADRDVVELVEIDGARVTYPEGWGLVRASNTQPAFVLVFEAPDEGRLAAVKRRFAAKLAKYPSVSADLG